MGAVSVALRCGAEIFASEAELMRHQVPMGFRDYCSHVLIPLNNCRRANLYAGWKCGTQRHAYETCQWEDYLWRMKKESLTKQAKKDGAKVGVPAGAGGVPAHN